MNNQFTPIIKMNKVLLYFILIPFLGTSIAAQNLQKVELNIAVDEFWWAGITSHGFQMPYSRNSVASVDMFGDNVGNQAQPLLISSKGRFIWSEEPIKYQFKGGKLTVTVASGKIISGTAGSNLRTVRDYASKTFFPSNGLTPDPILFTKPQYNTWIELMYDQNEEAILKYANDIVAKGFTPGVLMIDDNWQEDYGVWEFSPRRFNDPKAMIQKLHSLGFKVMLWICPFVSADSQVFRKLQKDKVLVLDKDSQQEVLWADSKNKAAIIRWWNGASASVDLTNPEGFAWFQGRLDYLVKEYGVDGFKFDAGDADFYTGDIISFNAPNPNEHTTKFAELGLMYPLNEYRASWKMAGLPLAQRLRDKTHKWSDLIKLIPDQMSQSVIGYAYTCPDMIGGGEYQSFLNGATIDEELVVRSAQVHALMPMMQFSVSPWRVLSNENAAICLKMSKLHEQFGPQILELARAASKTGEPIVKPMELAWPGNGYELIKDQFVLGQDIIVAPVVEKGVRSRKVILPKGDWLSEDGQNYKGGKTIEVAVPLDRLPYFRKINYSTSHTQLTIKK
jgi:alpha-glucosidase (family GH31 glycosyl hydrolase)